MAYNIFYSRAAEKYLDGQTTAIRKRIIDAIDDLPGGDIKKLHGRKGYRLTVGSFRILFDIINDTIIDVITIAPRSDVYKK